MRGWLRNALMAAAITGSSWAADSEVWVRDDFDTALARAAQEKKDLLVDFSGSDWCGWCVRLNQEVFGLPAFTDAASKDFILCVLDFPRKPENAEKQTDAQKNRNRELMQKYGVRGFPTVLLMDKDGKVYGRTGYRPGGPEAYLKHLAETRAQAAVRGEAMAKADQPGLSPAERAKALDEALKGLDEGTLMSQYGKEVADIVAADPKNELGLRMKYLLVARMREVGAALQGQDPDKALGLLQSLVDESKPTGESLQKILGTRSQILMSSNRRAEAKDALRQAIDAAPESKLAPQMKMILGQLFPATEEKPAPAPGTAPAAP